MRALPCARARSTRQTPLVCATIPLDDLCSAYGPDYGVTRDTVTLSGAEVWAEDGRADGETLDTYFFGRYLPYNSTPISYPTTPVRYICD